MLDGNAWQPICTGAGVEPRFYPAVGFLPSIGLVLTGGSRNENLTNGD